MVAATTQIRVRVPARRMKIVSGILSRMGTDMDNVVNMVLAQIERERRLPDEITRSEEQPNATTLAAIEELESGKGLSFDNKEAFMTALFDDKV